MRNKFVLAIAAVASLVMVAAGPTAAAQATSNKNYGTFEIKVDLGERPFKAAPILNPAYIGKAKDFVLSDDKRQGTFRAEFNIQALDTPDFDTFKVTNTTDQDMVFGYVHEDQNVKPYNSNRDLSELLACFNDLCDADIYFPSGFLAPPVPLGVVPANSTVEFRVGMKLSPLADVQAWKGTTLATTLYFQNLAQ